MNGPPVCGSTHTDESCHRRRRPPLPLLLLSLLWVERGAPSWAARFPVMDVARMQSRVRSTAASIAADDSALGVVMAATTAADGDAAAKDSDTAARDSDTADKDSDVEHRRFVAALADRPRLAAPPSPPVDHADAADGVESMPDTGCVSDPSGGGGGGKLLFLDLPVDDTQLLLRMETQSSAEPVSPRPVSSSPLWDDACEAAQVQVDAIAEAMEREDGLVLPASLASSPASASSSSSLPAVSGLSLAPSVSVALLEKISRLPHRSSSASRMASAYAEYTAARSSSRSGRCSRLPSLNEDEDMATATSGALRGGPGIPADTGADNVGATGSRSRNPAVGRVASTPCGGDDGALEAADLEQLAQQRAARRRYRSMSRGRPVKASGLSSSGVALLSRGRSLVRMASGTPGSRPTSHDVGLGDAEQGDCRRSVSAIAPAVLRTAMMGLPPVTAVGGGGGGVGGGGSGGGSGSGGSASGADPPSHTGSISALQERRSSRRVGLATTSIGDAVSRQSSDESSSDGGHLAASPSTAAATTIHSPLVGRSRSRVATPDAGDRRCELAHGSITDLSSARQAGEHFGATRLECSPRVRYRRLSCGRRPVVLEVMPVVGEDRLTSVHVNIAERCARARSGSPCRTREMVVTLRGGEEAGIWGGGGGVQESGPEGR